MSNKVLSLYNSWREHKQYTTQVSQQETNNATFDMLIEEEQRKSNTKEKLIDEEEIDLGSFEFPELKFDVSFEKRRKQKIHAKLFKLFAICFSILLILFICTLIILLSALFITHLNRPVHFTLIDNTEEIDHFADYEFYDIYQGQYPSNYLSSNETDLPFKPLSFTIDQKKELIEFYALSDFHLDISYDDKKVCKNQGEQSKPHSGDKNNYKLGQFQCDSPESLLHSLFKKMLSFNKKADFILFTGDIIKHGDLEKEEYLDTFDSFKKNYLKYFPDTVFLPVIGNHDLYPRKSYIEIVDNNENLAEIADGVTFSLPPSAVETFKKGGYYSYLLPSPALSDDDSSTLLISLNNIIYSPDWIKGCKKEVGSEKECMKQRGNDPFDQFAWLKDQLKHAQKSGYKVMIAMHYGLGRSRGGDAQWEDNYQDTFIDILTTYQDTITTIITGHSHRDLFRLLPDFLKNKIAVLENSSLTPIDGSNPSFRYMYLNSTTSHIIDYQHAYFNLSGYVSNEMQEDEAWKIEYEFEKQYNVKPNAPGYIHLYNQMLEFKVDADNSYAKFLSDQVITFYSASSTTGSKKDENELLCAISKIMNADSANCFSDDDDDKN